MQTKEDHINKRFIFWDNAWINAEWALHANQKTDKFTSWQQKALHYHPNNTESGFATESKEAKKKRIIYKMMLKILIITNIRK